MVYLAACGGKTDPLEGDFEESDVGGQHSTGGTSGRPASGGQGGFWAGGANVGGFWYGGHPNVGAWPGYGGFPLWPTGGFGPGQGGAPIIITDGGIPWDALPLDDGGPVADCVACARNYCSAQIDACVATSICLGGILCAALQCQPNQYDCMMACFGNDITALTAGINAATCLVTQCSLNCVGAFGGGGVN